MKLKVFEHFQNGGTIKLASEHGDIIVHRVFTPYTTMIVDVDGYDVGPKFVYMLCEENWEIYEEPKKLETFNFMKAMELSQGCHSVTRVAWKSKVLPHGEPGAHISKVKLDLTLEDVFATDWYEVEASPDMSIGKSGSVLTYCQKEERWGWK